MSINAFSVIIKYENVISLLRIPCGQFIQSNTHEKESSFHR